MPTPSWRDLQYMVEQKQKGYSVDPKYDAYFESIKNIGEREPLQLNRQTAPAYLQAAGEQVREANEALAEYSNDFGIDYGAYKGDATVPFSQFINDPINYRANSQSNGEKLRNGAIKMFPYMATTFVDNTVGLIDAALISGPFKDGRNYLDNFINSWTGEAMQKVRDWSEEKLPNYRTTQELNDQEHWWKYMNANFWGDTFIKNLGFTLGAGLSGNLAAKGFRAMQGKVVRDAYKAAVAAAVDGNAAAESTFAEMMRNGMLQNPNKVYKAFNKGSKSFGKLSMQSQLIGGVTGAIGESRVEALNAAKEFREPAVAKAQQKLMQDTRALEQEMYNPENGYTENIPVYDGYGNIVGSNIGLSEEGQRVLAERQQKLQEQYDKEVAAIDNEAYKVAYTTFGLNLPVLTGSNIVMFGRYFSGGFNTQKGIKLRGTLGNYKGTGSVGKAIGMGVKNAATEGMEELTQKVISEGAKDIADSNMAAFHNGKYDTKAIKNWSMDWLSSMGQSAENVIHDPTSWEEFAVGFLTGALGMPTRVGVRNWSGGIIGGIQEGLQERNNSRELANQLNERVQDPKFRALWEGAIRHNVYERQKDDALNTDDSYAWHSANDKQLLSDVMMFADAGRLQDLESVVDTFANVTEEDINSTDLIDDGDPRFANMNDSEKVNWLKKRAEDVKKTINRFKDSRDAINFAEFKVSPDSEAMNELIYTQASLFNIADRYDSILGEMLSDIRGTISINATNGNTTAQEILNGLNNMQNVFLGYSDVAESSRQRGQSPSVHMLNDAEIDEVKKNLNAIKTIAGSGWERKIDDLQKLINDGRNLYSKLYSQEFKDSFAKKFEEQAKQPEQVAKELEAEMANEQTKDIKTINDVKQAYFEKDATGRAAFLNTLMSAEDSNPAIKEFLKMKRRHEGFQAYIAKNGFSLPDITVTPPMIQSAINDIIRLAKSEEELINLPDSVFSSLDEFIVYNTGPFGAPSAATYAAVKQSVRQLMADYMAAETGTASRATINPAPVISQPAVGTVSTPTGRDAAQPGSVEPAPAPATLPEWMTGGAKESAKEFNLDTHPVVRAALTSFKGFPNGVTEVGYVDQDDYPFVRLEKNGRKFMLTFSSDTKGKIKGNLFEYNKSSNTYKPLDVEPEKYFEQAKKAVSSYVPDSFIDLLQKYADNTVDEDRFRKELHDRFNIYYLNTALLGTKYEASDSNINRIKKELLGQSVPVSGKKDEWQVEVPVVQAPTNETLAEDAVQAGLDSLPQDVEDKKVHVDGTKDKIAYYRTSIPEIETGEAAKARNAILNGDRDALKKADLTDFVNKHPEYAEIWNALAQRGAFNNVATRLEVNDVIQFVVDPTFPSYKGQYQILMTTVKDGERLVLNVLSGQTSKYYGLDALRKAIDAEYRAFIEQHPNEMFVFSKAVRVWGKRAGLIDYDYTGGEKGIVNIPGYNDNVPIVFINRNGDAVLARGNNQRVVEQVSDTFNDRFYNTEHNKIGNLYYLVKSDSDRYIPIRLNIEHFRAENKDSNFPVFSKIRGILNNITDIVKAANTTNIEEQNNKLRTQLHELGKYLDIHNDFFEIGEYENVGVALRYSSPVNEGMLRRPDQISSEWLTDFVAGLGRSIQLRQDVNGKITALDEYVDTGIITSNARMLRPKGVDFYINHWVEADGKFADYDTAQEGIRTENLGNETVNSASTESSTTSKTAELDDDFSGRESLFQVVGARNSDIRRNEHSNKRERIRLNNAAMKDSLYNELIEANALKNMQGLSQKKLIDKLLRLGVSMPVINFITEGIREYPSLAALSPYDAFIQLQRLVTIDLNAVYEKAIKNPIDKSLNAFLQKYLERYNIKVKQEDLENRFGVEGVTGAYDVIEKTIWLANNPEKMNELTFPEEFAHAFIELMGSSINYGAQSDDFKFLYNTVTTTDIYERCYEQYKNIYKKADGSPDEYRIRKEAIGQALAAEIVNNWNNKSEKDSEKTFFGKLKEWFTKIINQFKGKYMSFELTIDDIANSILNEDYSRLNVVDDTGYRLLDYASTLEMQNSKDGGKALRFMQYFSKIGNIITGSLAYRKHGTVYRSKLDSLHDIDMIVPASVHGLNNVEILKKHNYRTRNNQAFIEDIIGSDYFKQIKKQYPKIVFSSVYNSKEYITVNAVYSENEELSKRFASLSGSYADRLNTFTEDKRNQIYLFDFFLRTPESNTVDYDSENHITLANYKTPLREKLAMGRAKDIYDYQMFKAYEEFRGETNIDDFMFQQDISQSKQYQIPANLIHSSVRTYPKPLQEQIAQKGYTDKEFDEMGDLLKEKVLKCIGI